VEFLGRQTPKCKLESFNWRQQIYVIFKNGGIFDGIFKKLTARIYILQGF
jgi:hypothetical protein